MSFYDVEKRRIPLLKDKYSVMYVDGVYCKEVQRDIGFFIDTCVKG